MKIHRFALTAVLLSSAAFAQTTNTYPFPASGNVGIGTTNPGTTLHVNGSVLLSSSATNITPGFNGEFGNPNVGNSGGFRVNRNSGTAGTKIFSSYHSNSGNEFYHEALSNIDSRFVFLGGAVGIGTTLPNQQLSINGNLSLGTTGSFIMMGQSAYTGGGGYIFLKSTGDLGRDFSIQNYSNAAGWRTNLFVSGESGNVGIGTISPTAKLHVSGGHALIDGAASTNQDLFIANAGGRKVEIVTDSNGDSMLMLRDASGTATQVAITAGGASYFNGGNVGIGTTNPTHKLAVNGTIKAKEVIVETTGWSDYVFADGYALQPLAEVEAHIKTNKHLPGIPSAAEVSEQGVSVGDMQSRLLAKIEELTLHQIAQEKLLRVQAGQLAAQANELATLREEVHASRH